MTIKDLDKEYIPQNIENRWYPHWVDAGYFKAADTDSERSPFCIVIPPPNITGNLHMGHALTLSIQDMMIRTRRMQGYNTLWLPGTDHAGIATQMVVERGLQSEGLSRHDIGREKFLERVWDWKNKHGNRITEQTKVMAASVDWDRERFTLDQGLSRAVREVFVRLYEEGLIYRSDYIINWCPSCQTALSDLEVELTQNPGSLWYIAYPVVDSEEELVVATTRPETMLGDTAVAVHPDDIRYNHLIGKFCDLPLTDRKIPIIGDAELVDMEFGTGSVKVTPAHDFNDFETGLRHNLERVQVINKDARMTADAGKSYEGSTREDCREKVLKDLTDHNFLRKSEDYQLQITTCQRCRCVVEPLISKQWFVKIKPLAEPAIEAVRNGDTVFIPQQWEKTYFNWMENIRDWCISRQLWWGHQIPAWYCQECGEVTVSREDIEKCGACKSSKIEQDPDVLDTWFSSALWPFSTLGWPDNTEALKTFYPTSVMETGFDIIFFWVARMMMMGLKFMGEVPFKTVYFHAMVRDEHGHKMSKTRGNVIDPLEVTEKFGADPLRFTLISMAGQGRDIKLSMDRVEGYKHFCNKIWNASRFVLMNLEGFDPSTSVDSTKYTLADSWILYRTAQVVEEATAAFESYRFNDVAHTLYQFFWHEFCAWYIELAKQPLYNKEGFGCQSTTQHVLVRVLDTALRMLHPIMPYITEEIWQAIPKTEDNGPSIVIAPWPKMEEWTEELDQLDNKKKMDAVIEVISKIRDIRGGISIDPGRRINVVIRTSDTELKDILDLGRPYMQDLARLDEITILEQYKPHGSVASGTFTGGEVYLQLEGIIDIDQEVARLEKQIDKINNGLKASQRKLSNPKFTDNAPPEVVEKERLKVDDYQTQIQKLRNALKMISKG